MTDETKPAVSVDALPTCPECGRRQAQSAGDAARGLCPKRWAPRDELAEKDCRRHAALAAQGQEPVALIAAARAMAEDYQTSANHHPDHVLVPRKAFEDMRSALTAPAQPVGVPDDTRVQDRIIGQIEELFPNWRSYRDLIDCIECTLHDLRKQVGGHM